MINPKSTFVCFSLSGKEAASEREIKKNQTVSGSFPSAWRSGWRGPAACHRFPMVLSVSPVSIFNDDRLCLSWLRQYQEPGGPASPGPGGFPANESRPPLLPTDFPALLWRNSGRRFWKRNPSPSPFLDFLDPIRNFASLLLSASEYPFLSAVSRLIFL